MVEALGGGALGPVGRVFDQDSKINLLWKYLISLRHGTKPSSEAMTSTAKVALSALVGAATAVVVLEVLRQRKHREDESAASSRAAAAAPLAVSVSLKDLRARGAVPDTLRTERYFDLDAHPFAHAALIREANVFRRTCVVT